MYQSLVYGACRAVQGGHRGPWYGDARPLQAAMLQRKSTSVHAKYDGTCHGFVSVGFIRCCMPPCEIRGTWRYMEVVRISVFFSKV